VSGFCVLGGGWFFCVLGGWGCLGFEVYLCFGVVWWFLLFCVVFVPVRSSCLLADYPSLPPFLPFVCVMFLLGCYVGVSFPCFRAQWRWLCAVFHVCGQAAAVCSVAWRRGCFAVSVPGGEVGPLWVVYVRCGWLFRWDGALCSRFGRRGLAWWFPVVHVGWQLVRSCVAVGRNGWGLLPMNLLPLFWRL